MIFFVFFSVHVTVFFHGACLCSLMQRFCLSSFCFSLSHSIAFDKVQTVTVNEIKSDDEDLFGFEIRLKDNAMNFFCDTLTDVQTWMNAIREGLHSFLLCMMVWRLDVVLVLFFFFSVLLQRLLILSRFLPHVVFPVWILNFLHIVVHAVRN